MKDLPLAIDNNGGTIIRRYIDGGPIDGGYNREGLHDIGLFDDRGTYNNNLHDIGSFDDNELNVGLYCNNGGVCNDGPLH